MDILIFLGFTLLASIFFFLVSLSLSIKWFDETKAFILSFIIWGISLHLAFSSVLGFSNVKCLALSNVLHSMHTSPCASMHE